MTKHPLDIFADNWKNSEEQYFSNQPVSLDFFELALKGNPKTGSQIKDWVSAGVIEMKKELESWDWSKPYEPNLTGEPEVKKFERLLSADSNPVELPNLGYMELFKSSKVTDFITGSFLQQYGLIVSMKAKEIMEQHTLGEAKFYPLMLEHKGTFYKDYFFLKTLSSAIDFIDFEKSLFYQQDGFFGFETRKDIQIHELQDVEKHKRSFKENDTYLYIKKIVLNDCFPNYDYFTFYGYGVSNIFISSKLAMALKATTGHEIKPTNRIFR